MEYKPAEFKSVPFGTLNKSSCSPVAPNFDKEKRLLIRTPREILLSKDELLVLPICIYYNLDTIDILGSAFQIHIQDAKKTKPSSSVVVTKDPEDFEVPDPSLNTPLDPKHYLNQVSTAYTYLDAQKYFKENLRAGEYLMHLSYGKAKSNTEKFKITILK